MAAKISKRAFNELVRLLKDSTLSVQAITSHINDYVGSVTEDGVRLALKNLKRYGLIDIDSNGFYTFKEPIKEVLRMDEDVFNNLVLTEAFSKEFFEYLAADKGLVKTKVLEDDSPKICGPTNFMMLSQNLIFHKKAKPARRVGMVEELAELKLDALLPPIIKTDVEIRGEYPWLDIEKIKRIEDLDDKYQKIKKIKEWLDKTDDVEVRQNARRLIELLQAVVTLKPMISIFIYDRQKDVFIFNESALEREAIGADKEALYRFFYYQAVIDKVYGLEKDSEKFLYTFLKELYALHMIKDHQLREELYLYLLDSMSNRMLVALIHDPNTPNGINRRLEKITGIRVDTWKLLSRWHSVSREEKDSLYLFLLGVVNFAKDRI